MDPYGRGSSGSRGYEDYVNKPYNGTGRGGYGSYFRGRGGYGGGGGYQAGGGYDQQQRYAVNGVGYMRPNKQYGGTPVPPFRVPCVSYNAEPVPSPVPQPHSMARMDMGMPELPDDMMAPVFTTDPKRGRMSMMHESDSPEPERPAIVPTGRLIDTPGMALASCMRTVPSEDTAATDAVASLKRIRRRDYNVTYWGDKMNEVVNRMCVQYKHLVAYAVFQRELCPSTQRPHWQMYIEFFNPQDISFVKTYLFNDQTTHVEIRLRSREDCRQYCKKTKSRMPGEQADVGPFEFGVWREQGQGQKMQAIREAIADGQDVADLAIDEPAIVLRHRTNLVWYQDQLNQRASMNKNREVTVRLFIGPTGCGKTHLALEEAKFYSGGNLGKVFILDSGGKPNSLWFCGYEHSMKCMVIDDYDSWIQVAYFLRVLDKYPVRLQVKNGSKWANYTEVWITSNKPLQQWTNSDGAPIDECHQAALYRRIDWIMWMPSRGKYSIIKKPDSVPMPLYRPELPTTSAVMNAPVPTPPASCENSLAEAPPVTFDVDAETRASLSAMASLLDPDPVKQE